MKQVANYSFVTKLSFILSFVVIITFSQPSFGQELITIQQAIDKTLTNNLQVKQSKLSESLSDVTLQQSKLALYPNLNASINQSMGWGRNQVASGLYQNIQNYNLNPSISSGIDVFNGFSKINQIKQNKLLLDAGKTNTEKVKNDLILSVITSYLQILYNKDFLKAADDQLTVAKQQLNQQQQLLDVGNKTLADLSQSKSQVATAELNVTNAANALSISYLTLAQLMDIPSSSVYEVQAPVIDSFKNPSTSYNAEEVYNNALNLFPDIKLAGLNTAAAKIGVKVAEGNLYPSLSFNGSYRTSYFYNFNSTLPNDAFQTQLKNNISKGVGLNLSIPIFNGLQAKSGVKRARINLMQTETQEQLAKNNLNKIIYQAVADLKAAESRFQSTGNAFTAQKDAFYVIEQRYAVGLVNSLDYSTAQTNRNKAEIDYIQAKYDLIFRAKVIDYYLGKQIIF
ncbi:TolC family protein [Pedobacter frigiditerrae]|uniref:TolC family protein n=1 Tax=Pedobacter frigiditerrae TaxID=2530452 RepID=A0A4V2MHX5_9SPHI|nr:TolC family protein [Pedobacter frigiditerrae]TCC88166.1 TolC family protein [Pedobacter frigiditerrae]